MRIVYRITFLCAVVIFTSTQAQALEREMARFAAAKENQAREIADAQTFKVPATVWSFFDAVRVDDWETATNLFARLERSRYAKSAEPGLATPVWATIAETVGTYEIFHEWDGKWLRRFGSDVIARVPNRSIFFGGTAAGRYIISAFSESHREGLPFFTVTQNQLADEAGYLVYLRNMYGPQIYIPSEEDSQRIFREYTEDAERRMKAGKLKPGEVVRRVNNKLEVSGQVSVMELNALLSKIIVEKNPDREIYLEESLPMDWMYPQLVPHGPIFKVNRTPLASLSKDIVAKDQEYWSGLVNEALGSWLTEKTSVKEVCEFAERTYLRKDLKGFKGDANYIGNFETQQGFAKLRGSIAGLYSWRADRAKDEDDAKRMRAAADFAFKQALALGPKFNEVVIRYAGFLRKSKRSEDALLVAQTALRLDPENAMLDNWVKRLRELN